MSQKISIMSLSPISPINSCYLPLTLVNSSYSLSPQYVLLISKMGGVWCRGAYDATILGESHVISANQQPAFRGDILHAQGDN